jgi:hypothetical protein
MGDEALYEERVSSTRTQVLFWSLAGAFLILFAWRTYTTGSDAVAVALLLVFLFFLFSSVNYRVLLIRLMADSLNLRFGVFKWTIPLDNVEACRLDDLPRLVRCGGAGMHFMFIRKRYRVSFNFLEYPRVVVALRKARIVRDVSFTTRRPTEVVSLLNAVKPVDGAA